MVKGFDSFKNWFQGYENKYTIIGGTACDILMSEEGIDFRATKDIDLVLIMEALDADFGTRFWEYIKEAGYEHRNKSTGTPQFYRFSKPETKEFPYMIELFSRRVDAINLPEDAVLSPIPIDEDVSSLSAILLDDAYYSFLRDGNLQIDGVSVLGAEYLIPFKAKAWIDLSERKAYGENVDSKNVKKHRNDVFRLTELINPDQRIKTPQIVLDDLHMFIEKMQNETIDLKQLGIVGRNKEEVLEELSFMYVNEENE